MYHSDYVRRNPNQPRFADRRMQSNPQTIPRNPGIAPIPRGGATAPANYSYNSHGQSPQYVPASPQMYPAVNPADMNSTPNQVAPPPSTKQHHNGQYVWQGQRMQFAPQSQHPPGQHQSAYPGGGAKYQQHLPNSAQYQAYAQNTSNVISNAGTPYVYVHTPRFSNHHVPQTHPSMASTSPGYYQPAPATFYANSQLSYAAAPYEQMPFQPGSQPPMSTTVMQPPHHAPASQPAPAPLKKNAIKIINPDTMQEVAVDRAKTRTESESSAHSRSSPPTVTQPQQDEQIAATFAAKVAAAATDDVIDKPSQAPPSSEAKAVPPSDVDAATQQKVTSSIDQKAAPSQNNNTANGAVLNADAKKFTNGSSSSHLVKTGGIRPPAPVAVVQPLPHAPVEVTSKPPVPRIEKILSRGEALPPLKDSKDVGAIEPASIDDELFEPTKSSETLSFECTIEPETKAELKNGAKTPPESSTTPPASQSESLPDQKEELPVKEASEEVQTPPEKESEPEKEVETPKEVLPEPSKAAPEKIEKEESSVEPVEAAAPSSESTPPSVEKSAVKVEEEVEKKVKEEVDKVEEEIKTDLKPPLSGGEPAVKESAEKTQLKAPTPEVKPKLEESKPDVVPVIQNAPPVKSQVSCDESNSKSVPKSEPILKSESADRRKYERDFLIKCRDHESTREKPSLPDLPDIVMKQCLPNVSTSLPSLSSNFGAGADFTPGWMNSGGRNPRMERQTSRGSQGGQGRQGYYQQQPQKIIKKVVSIQREPEPELNKAENAWKPSKFEKPKSKLDPKPSVELSDEEQTAEILKNVRAILNKLTPQKFTPLMQKFKLLPINTENRLRDVINLVFEKAIDEPNFCEAYANMCRVMSQYRVTAPGAEATTQPQTEGGQQPVVVFRKVLLTRCQKEFEKDRTSENNLSIMRKKVEEAKTEEEKKTRKEELDQAEAKERRRIMGNIRFIGELFKLSMLTEQIMHNCIMALFRARDEESLESLCKLLTTIGVGLDHVKGKHLMDQYFQQIDKIIAERKISSRVKFMLIDVKDLRKSNWVQRAIKSQGPKTIDQIHQDAKEEKEKMALKASVSAGKSQSRGNRMGSRNSSSHNLAEDGWQNVTQKPMRIDPQKMKFSKIDEANVTLGPNRGKQMWKSGSGGATKTGSGSYSYRDADGMAAPRSNTPTTVNRFSALSAVGNQDGFYPGRPGGRMSSQERTKSGSRGSGANGESRVQGRDERQIALDAVRRMTSAERKPPQTGAPPPAAKQAPALITEANDAMLKKLSSIIVEYLHLLDIREATECFEELRLSPKLGHVIVKACLEESLEKKGQDRINVSRLLSSLVKNDKIQPDQYIKGVSDIMELAVDLELDLPKVWTCIAELVSGTFHTSSGKIGLDSLKEIAAPLLEFQKADIFLAEILKQLIKEQTDVNKVLQDWRNSNLQMEYFMQNNNPSSISAFLDKHELRPFYGAAELPPTSGSMTSSRLNLNDLVEQITKQLDMHSPDDPIFDWVESTTSSLERSEPVFLRALVTAVCNKAIVQGTDQLEVNKKLVTSRSILLRKFLDTEDKELQAVYALQRLFVDLEQPPNVLKHLFDLLYDEEVISEQTFYKWEKSEDSSELEGKGVALLSVNPFFTWLRHAEVESDE